MTPRRSTFIEELAVLLLLVCAALALDAREGNAQQRRRRAATVVTPPRLATAPPTPRFPDMLASAGVGGEVEASFVVDTAGRIAMATVRFDDTPANDIFRVAVRNVLPRWRFVPARDAHGRLVEAPAAARFHFDAEPNAWRDSGRRACADCDSALEALRDGTRRAAERHAACAAALREIARTDATDTLAFAVAVAPRCEGGASAAPLAVRLIGYGGHPDDVQAARVRLALLAPSAEVFDAALDVAARGYAGARPYALAVLEALATSVPRAIAERARSGAEPCGPYLIQVMAPTTSPAPTSLPPSLATPYRDRARTLASRLIADASSPAPVRAAARCLAEDLREVE